jgi:predicted ATP-grasp superfamily ATP-dependent carboligase
MNKNRLPLEGIKVLTTDPEKRIGLYAIRYLGRAGAQMSSIGHQTGSKIPIGFLSKYLKTGISVKSGDYLLRLKDFLIKHSREYDIINPIDISKMLCVLDADKEFNLKCNYLLPKRESLVVADNKELLTKHALELGLNCPKTFSRIAPEEIKDLSIQLTYPCIIKFRGDNRETHWNPEERYSIVTSPETLTSEYRRMHDIEKYPIIQEYIRGSGFGYFALYDRNRNLKAQFCHKRIREYPITGGPSSCCESIYDSELIRIGKSLIESLDWTGLAMVEFKFDEARKQFFIIEINPRYWGSLPLAVSSGVNFPLLHALSSLDIDYEPVLDYKRGVKVRFLDKDVKSILTHILRNHNSFGDKVRLFLEIFNPLIKEGFITLDDIGPLLGHRRFRRGEEADLSFLLN